ncbi:MAG: hypothetical protein ACJAZ9_000182 [Neolewinella sp.]|jgi:hypothetical protein
MLGGATYFLLLILFSAAANEVGVYAEHSRSTGAKKVKGASDISLLPPLP